MFLIIINFAVEKHLNPLIFFNMAKKVFMIAPFEAMTGNLSGDQNLQYAENNNPAYEAPNGTQYARNYRTRYVGARRGRDGLVYFQVKQTTATVLTPSTRRTMAILGVTAAIRSAMQTSGVLNSLKIYFDILKQEGRLPEGQETFNKWFSANIKNMLVYKRAEWRFNVPGEGIISIHNPYHLSSAEALSIKQSTWLKFANYFAFGTAGTLARYAYFTIDGVKFIAFDLAGDGDPAWDQIKQADKPNPNYVASVADINVTESAVTYLSQVVYTMSGNAVDPGDLIYNNDKYTTADPNI